MKKKAISYLKKDLQQNGPKRSPNGISKITINSPHLLMKYLSTYAVALDLLK